MFLIYKKNSSIIKELKSLYVLLFNTLYIRRDIIYYLKLLVNTGFLIHNDVNKESIKNIKS